MNTQINNQVLYNKCNNLLVEMYGANARFKEGQYEAIEATLSHRRTLVVQKTGWGKSLIYFMCTKILREQGKGLTIVISPLMALMDNQKEAAELLDLNVAIINSNYKDYLDEYMEEIRNDEIDLLLITPESLFSAKMEGFLEEISIGLFVIDECHCISDWGNDFRLEYGNINKIIEKLPSTMPLLATTATANDRVVEDLEKQLGDGVYTLRGPLTRESLSIQVIKMNSMREKYAWLLDKINKIPGTGIIYCLTTRDCDYVYQFLNENGIKVGRYYSKGLNPLEAEEWLQKFKNNEIKAIVATVKLGMGFDKDDVAFVIHMQRPMNVVSYYQQIGRAGRKLDNAYAIMLYGEDDEEILDSFIETAFPTEYVLRSTLNFIEEHPGYTKTNYKRSLNFKQTEIEKAIGFLLNENFIFAENGHYYPTVKTFTYNGDYYESIREQKRIEKRKINEIINCDGCLSKYIVNALDDFSACDCGKCSNCIKKDLFENVENSDALNIANAYFEKLILKIEPRKQYTLPSNSKSLPFVNQEGICLSRYNAPGYGALVKRDKYQREEFCDELVEKSYHVLKDIVSENAIRYMTCVPSLRSNMVQNFAERLAKRLGIKFLDLLGKRPSRQQKEMDNMSFQCMNALKSFYIKDYVAVPEKIILVDDMVDSRWTLTICGLLLGGEGASFVLPYALADSKGEGDE